MKELTYENVREVFWTDSQVVLGYISNEAKRFHTFVANRVQFIRYNTDIKCWNHISSAENTADYASRGLSTSQKDKTKRWFEGPEFLKEPEENWPKNNSEFGLESDDPEVKKQKLVVNTLQVAENDVLTTLEQRISCWFRLKRIVARILSWKTYKRSNPGEKLKTEDLVLAEKNIIKFHQRKFFAKDSVSLAKNFL